MSIEHNKGRTRYFDLNLLRQYTVNILDILESHEIAYYKINYAPIVYNVRTADNAVDTAILYIVNNYGDLKFRIEMKRYVWSKVFVKLLKYFKYLNDEEIIAVDDFLRYTTWIDNTDIIIDKRGYLVVLPNPTVCYQLFKAYNLDLWSRRKLSSNGGGGGNEEEAEAGASVIEKNFSLPVDELSMSSGNKKKDDEEISNFTRVIKLVARVLITQSILFILLFIYIVVVDMRSVNSLEHPGIYSNITDRDKPYKYDNVDGFRSKRSLR